MTIHEEFHQAGLTHGHYCPGLAIGVRAAVEGRNAVGNGDDSICCIVERSACWLDGMLQIGATMGNGKLKIRDTGKAAFSFYNTANGKSVRLVLKPGPGGMNREESIQWLLTAPLDEVFALGEVKVPFPEYLPGPRDVTCTVCGEQVLETHAHVKDGQFVCCDCL